MRQFIGTITIPDSSGITVQPKTYAELIRAAIAARDYGANTQARTDHADAFKTCIVHEGFVNNLSNATIYEADAWKGVTNSVASPSAGYVATDFTTGGFPIAAGDQKHFNKGTDLGNHLIAQFSGAPIQVAVDVKLQA